MKEMYALTWCYEGVDDNTPSAQTIAVSESKDKLIAELQKWVDLDTVEIKPEDYEDQDEYEEDAWDDDRNFQVVRSESTDVLLQHRKQTNLYTRYRIQSTQFV